MYSDLDHDNGKIIFSHSEHFFLNYTEFRKLTELVSAFSMKAWMLGHNSKIGTLDGLKYLWRL